MGVLDDKVVVVTGSTRGIGRAIAEACSEAGAAVVISSRNALAVEETAAALAAKARRVAGAVCDVRNGVDVERLLDETIDAFGRVDVWINNAGVPQGIIPLDEMSEEEACQIITVNVIGTMNGCRVALPYLKKNGGTIINITGKGGGGRPSAYTSVYAASKAAVSSLTKSLAAENRGSPVSIHLLNPGMVPTDFYRDMRVGKNLEARAAGLPNVLSAIGVPPQEAGKLAVEIAAAKPGETTGKTYSAFKRGRMIRGLTRLLAMRVSGKIRA
jgi:NAD(P)-dependent dehydrogenase (short-subunit alcohol dehydrogenase family)